MPDPPSASQLAPTSSSQSACPRQRPTGRQIDRHAGRYTGKQSDRQVPGCLDDAWVPQSQSQGQSQGQGQGQAQSQAHAPRPKTSTRKVLEKTPDFIKSGQNARHPQQNQRLTPFLWGCLAFWPHLLKYAFFFFQKFPGGGFGPGPGSGPGHGS